MKRSTIALLALLVIFLISFGPLATYYLPSTMVVTITGTEVKRSETGTTPDGAPASLRDVRYLATQDPKTKEIHVFRNEDTRWAWPPYFKFNSADLAGVAMEIAKSKPQQTVLVTYYGTRSSVLDLYPNIVGLEEVPADYEHVPVFNIVFVTVVLLLVGFTIYYVRKTAKRVGAWWNKKDTPADPPAPAAG